MNNRCKLSWRGIVSQKTKFQLLFVIIMILFLINLYYIYNSTSNMISLVKNYNELKKIQTLKLNIKDNFIINGQLQIQPPKQKWRMLNLSKLFINESIH